MIIVVIVLILCDVNIDELPSEDLEGIFYLNYF